MGVINKVFETARVLRGGLRKDVLENASSKAIRQVARSGKGYKRKANLERYMVEHHGSASDKAAYRAANIATHASRAAAVSTTALAGLAYKKYRDNKKASMQSYYAY